MDKSKQVSRHPIVLAPADVHPALRLCNYLSPSPGSIWGPRVIPDFEWILIIDGLFSYEDVRGEYEEFTSGDLCIIPPEVEHTFRHIYTSDTSKPTFACIHLELLKGAKFSCGDYVLKDAPGIKTVLRNLRPMENLFHQVAYAWEQPEYLGEELLSSLAKTIWLYACSHYIGPDVPKISFKLQEMTAYLRMNYMRPVGREDLAKIFKVTPQYVNRLFKSELNITPTEYLNRYRIEQACEFLNHSGMTVAAVSELVGFSDQFYFSRVFRKYKEASPAEYRKK